MNTHGNKLYPVLYDTTIYKYIVQYIQSLQKNALNAINDFTKYNNSYIWTGNNIIDPVDTEISDHSLVRKDYEDNIYNLHDPYTEYVPVSEQNKNKKNVKNIDKNKHKYKILRIHLESYFNTLKNIYIMMVPKICMTHLIRELQQNLYKYLSDKLTLEIIESLHEDETITNEKKKLRGLIEKITIIKNIPVLNL